MNKLDPKLKTLLTRSRPESPREPEAPARAERAPGPPPPLRARRARPVPKRVNITVKFTGALADLTAEGLKSSTVLTHPTKGFTIATGSIALAQLDALIALEHVVKVEGTPPLRPDLDKSVPEIKAGPDHFPASEFTGHNVVIGVIDSGFDFLHPVFRKAEGGVRILAIWDQTLKAEDLGKEPPDGFEVGIEFTAEEIQEAVDAADEFGTEVARSMVPTKDRTGHGTGVAGIAAGNGSTAGNCRGAFTFVGVAPEAELIFVRHGPEVPVYGESENLIDALRYIFEHPSAAGRPVVVNISQGDNLGPHDGTSLVEQAIDTFLFTPGRAVVKSAGNEARQRRHAAATVDKGGTLELEFKVMPDDDEDRFLELWYPGSGTLVARVIVPVVPKITSKLLAPGEDPDVFAVGPTSDPTTVTLEVLDTDADNGDRTIGLKLSAPEDGNHLPSGPWILELRNPTTEDIEIDAWIDRGDNAPQFTDHFTRATTVNIPGTAESVITAAAYSPATSATGDVDPDSGRGPTRRKSTVPEEPRPKPDIAAPGGPITAARANKEESGCSDCCVSFYTAKGATVSTSFAAPHVTGAIALMFEKNPFLTTRTIKDILQRTAADPVGEPDEPLPNFEWGAGRLNVSAALDEVPEPGMDGGGGRSLFVEPAAHAASSGSAFSRPRCRERLFPPLSVTPAFTALRHHALATSSGQLYAALVSRYFSEVRRLIRANRRVAAVWRRIGGPELIGHLARRVFAPDLPLPAAIDDVPLAVGIRRFLALLERYSSPDLKRDIERHAPLMLALEGRSLNEILHAKTGLPSRG